jgi:formiminoglutamase
LFLPISPDIFFTKNDSEDIRLGDLAHNIIFEETKPNDFVIFGYPDDDGIKLNGGRTGAAEAPLKIRQFLYKMTPSYKKSILKQNIHDYGDLSLTSGDISVRHDIARKHLLKCLMKNLRVICLGGGHDYGFADASAFVDRYQSTHKNKPIIINFDAHMDVRPPKNGPNSGTPFYRLYEEHRNRFQLIEIGIQNQCNSPHHIRWAKERDIEIIDLDTLENEGWGSVWNQTSLRNVQKDQPVFVSFDIDALTASEAGGCSQAWATGLKINDCLKFLTELYKKADVRGFGIYEVSPPLDRDFQTSKTAALLLHHFIFNT